MISSYSLNQLYMTDRRRSHFEDYHFPIEEDNKIPCLCGYVLPSLSLLVLLSLLRLLSVLLVTLLKVLQPVVDISIDLVQTLFFVH